MEARIMRDAGTDANINEPGELWMRGNNVALGYWNNEKASKETFIDGWVHTGDIFRVDAGGNFWFVSLTIIFYAWMVRSYMIWFLSHLLGTVI
jgi:acyl-CoA synthetase (AMP-forming)/AMP-acid ligase II